MRGRKPKPAALHKLQGTDRADLRRKLADTAVAEGDLAEPPEHFCGERKAAWRYVIDNAPPGVLKRIDMSILEAWVDSCVTYRDAQRALQKSGLLIKTKSGNIIQSPYLGIANRQKLIMAKLAAEMGFTPSSRSRVKATPHEDKEPENPFQAFAVISGGKGK